MATSALPWATIPVTNYPLHAEILSNTQLKPLLEQLELIFSSPITHCLRKEMNTRLTAALFQTVVESKEAF